MQAEKSNTFIYEKKVASQSRSVWNSHFIAFNDTSVFDFDCGEIVWK
jgi:hypothetical protein